ncbi:MAG: type II toxin-antitoxin system HicA family toxin [Aridibacter sp.]
MIKELKKNGFSNRGGKGSHRNFEHPTGYRVTISGNLSKDAKKYQEELVRKALKEVNKK